MLRYCCFHSSSGRYPGGSALKREGQPLIGHIEGASSSTKRGRTFYWLKVNYMANGRSYKGGGDVSETVYRKYTFGGFYSSGEIPIRYLPSDPSVMRIADPGLPADFQEPSVFLWFFTLGMSAFGIYSIRQAIKDGLLKAPKRWIGHLFEYVSRLCRKISVGSLLPRPSPIVSLEEVKRLRDMDVITVDEYEAKKHELLKRI